MSVTITELVDSREVAQEKGPGGSLRTTGLTLKYAVEGTGSEATAVSTVESTAPATWGDLDRVAVAVEPEWQDSDADDGLWRAEVRYALPEEDAPETGDSAYSFDTSGGTQHITQSMQTISRTAAGGGTAPDHKGAIGVARTAEGLTVEGVDITVPVYSFSETHYIADASVDAAYKGKLFALTGKTNDASFKGLSAGECLFLGASGSKRGEEDWEITFHFAASPNRTDVAVGDITVPAVKGWEYLWVEYQEEVDSGATAPQTVKRPINAYVERVYDEGDFSDLGIGT